jgi:hypothetical protein
LIQAVKGCLDGSGPCSAEGGSMKQDVEKLFDKQSDLYAKQTKQLQDSINTLNQRMSELHGAISSWESPLSSRMTSAPRWRSGRSARSATS